MTLKTEGIEIGHHTTATFGGYVFNTDTIIATWVAAAIVLILGFTLRAKITAGPNPGKLQLFWESIVGWINGLVKDNLGHVHPVVAPLAVTLFVFILVANTIHFLPTHEKLVAAAADTNLTYAMSFFVIIGVHIFAVRHHGMSAYLKGYLKPYPVMAPLTILEELIKPFTLALRLFGNIFAGGVMVALIGMLPMYISWAPGLLWKLFDLAVGGIQAFIFALLTVLYFGMAASGHGGDDHDSHDAKAPEPEGELAHA